MDKRTLKKILKPDSKRIAGVAICLLVASFLLSGNKVSAPLPYWEYGFPFSFVSAYSIRGIWNDFLGINQIHYAYLFLDIIFWYLVGCLEVYAGMKLKKYNKK